MIELLRELDLFQGLDDEALAAFAAEGVERHVDPGETAFVEGSACTQFALIAEGTLEWSKCINGVDMVLVTREAPTYAGATNLLTGDPIVATGRAVTRLRVVTWEAGPFLQFLYATPSAMHTVVRLISPIAQRAESAALQQEKLAALGTLAAGLAHELNNPAAAARRTASELADALETLQDTVHQFVSSGVEREQAAQLVALQQSARAVHAVSVISVSHVGLCSDRSRNGVALCCS